MAPHGNGHKKSGSGKKKGFKGGKKGKPLGLASTSDSTATQMMSVKTFLKKFGMDPDAPVGKMDQVQPGF